MKKLCLFLTVVFLLISSQLYAADWSSEEGFEYLMDEEYQVKLAILRCMDRYENEDMARQCSHNQAEAYVDVVSSMEYLFKAQKDGFDVETPLNCLARGLNKFWNSEYNSANWISIRTYTSKCMDQ